MFIYFLPFVSAFIGWVTNYIAIKMLFHPKQPVHLLGLTIQGIFPKRQKQFAAKLGSTVANELLHFDDIAKQITSPDKVAMIKPILEQKLNHYINEELPKKLPILAMMKGTDTFDQVKQSLVDELDHILPDIMNKYAHQLGEHIDIENMVKEKVEQFSSDKLEAILKQIMSKEFRFVEIIGGVLGFIIGLFQVLMSRW